MKSHITLLSAVLVLSLTSLVLRAQAPNTKEPEDLARLRIEYGQRRVDALKPIMTWYEAQLEALQKKLTQSNDLDGALIVRRELESIREDSTKEGQEDLHTALLATKWSWADKQHGEGVAMTFHDDGTVSHIGMHGTWMITGPREVTITVSNGAKPVLRFDSELKSYYTTDGIVHGRQLK